MSDRIGEWGQVKREFDRYEFTWPQFRMDLMQPYDEGRGLHRRLDFGEVAVIRFSLWVRDTYHPEKVVEIVNRRSVPLGLPVDMFESWLLHQIREFIDHEVRENFKQDGVVIHDPHKTS